MIKKKRLSKEQALQKLRHYCGYQERCNSEVISRLYELGIDKREHDEIITKLAEENYINEERFATAFATGKFKLKEWGRKKIYYELKGRRINEDVIKNALMQIDEEDYLKALEKLATEKYASLKNEQYLIRKKKTMDYLMQKGYEFDLVNSFIKKAI